MNNPNETHDGNFINEIKETSKSRSVKGDACARYDLQGDLIYQISTTPLSKDSKEVIDSLFEIWSCFAIPPKNIRLPSTRVNSIQELNIPVKDIGAVKSKRTVI